LTHDQAMLRQTIYGGAYWPQSAQDTAMDAEIIEDAIDADVAIDVDLSWIDRANRARLAVICRHAAAS
jgi:hypothetical protein